MTDSQNYIAAVNADFQTVQCKLIEDRHLRSHVLALDGIQDLRLFEWRKELYAVGSAANDNFMLDGERHALKTTILLCRLNNGFLELVSYLPARQLVEKNWMPWVKDDQLFFIYESDPFTVLKHEGQDCRQIAAPTAMPSLAGQRGGSCVVPLGDRFIGVLHKRGGPTNREYEHVAVIYSKDFQVLAGERSLQVRRRSGGVLRRGGDLEQMDILFVRHLGSPGCAGEAQAERMPQRSRPGEVRLAGPATSRRIGSCEPGQEWWARQGLNL